jgi:hypothetical protein
MRMALVVMAVVTGAAGAWAQAGGRGGTTRGGASNFFNTHLATAPATASSTQAASQPMTLPARMRRFDTPYYILWTDVSDEEAREADLRLTRMFEEYQRRTAGFAGQVKEKLPFYLFRREGDYNAAGGPAKSAGVFIQRRDGSKRLMALAGERADRGTWSVIQHEGFHQFVAASIKYELPAWANEGLAEYFGEGEWTGDGFVTGLIPEQRLRQVRVGIVSRFKPFRALMNLSDDAWNRDLNEANYDEAWSMVHFLANADNGRYQGAFLQYMTAVSKGVPGVQAWEAAFGRDVDAFQGKYVQWWGALPDHPTQLGFYRVLMQTETSFLARAVILRQSFPDAQTFVTKYQPPGFVASRDLWLPPKLFTDWREAASNVGQWTFEGPRLVLQLPNGGRLVGSFTVANGRVRQVAVDATPPAGR